MDARERYNNDPQFRALVDLMLSYITRYEFTPSEVRIASMMASMKAEYISLRPGFVVKEMTDALRVAEIRAERGDDAICELESLLRDAEKRIRELEDERDRLREALEYAAKYSDRETFDVLQAALEGK